MQADMQAASSFVKHGKKVCHLNATVQFKILAGYQIIGIGRNYADHAKELGNQVPKEIIFFLKPTTSYVESGGKVEIPRGILAHHEGILHKFVRGVDRITYSYHCKVELGVVIGKGGRDITEQHADSHVAGYGAKMSCSAEILSLKVLRLALGVDMTARNLQEDVKKSALPWSAAKGFDTFTPIG
jgi:acylpyruvate hydrolase